VICTMFGRARASLRAPLIVCGISLLSVLVAASSATSAVLSTDLPDKAPGFNHAVDEPVAGRGVGAIDLPSLASAPGSEPMSRAPGATFDGPVPPLPSEPPAKPVVDPVRQKPLRELPEQRGERSEVWLNADGTRTLKSFTEVKYFEAQGKWEPVDNRVISDPSRPGVLKNARNSWSVEFSAVGGDGSGGVTFQVPDQPVVKFGPAEARSVAPEVVGDGTVVLYRDVWPGIDLRYTVRGNGIKEDAVIKRPGVAARVRFSYSGPTLASEGKGSERSLIARSAKGDRSKDITIPPPMVTRADGSPIGAASPTIAIGRESMDLAVDASWLSSLAPAEFPVLVDPSLTVGGSYWAGYSDNGYFCGTECNPIFGNLVYGTSARMRSVVCFPYDSLIDNHQRVVSASIHMGTSSGAAGAMPVHIRLRPGGWCSRAIRLSGWGNCGQGG
jgi:hypothetical protein